MRIITAVKTAYVAIVAPIIIVMAKGCFTYSWPSWPITTAMFVMVMSHEVV